MKQQVFCGLRLGQMSTNGCLCNLYPFENQNQNEFIVQKVLYTEIKIILQKPLQNDVTKLVFIHYEYHIMKLCNVQMCSKVYNASLLTNSVSKELQQKKGNMKNKNQITIFLYLTT